ncbi:unnamed protein product [Rotaria sordida]|uniref:Uncharacterized protein n=1 Tax=Rotaria sordida TaxID=392033 RepID=A0A815JHI0_9BILA|nr:unnamed protein product [Rotaria sordida]
MEDKYRQTANNADEKNQSMEPTNTPNDSVKSADSSNKATSTQMPEVPIMLMPEIRVVKAKERKDKTSASTATEHGTEDD